MDWMSMVDTILKAILIPLLPLLALWAKEWVSAKIAETKEMNKREYFNFHLDKVDDLIYTVVTEVEGVYVDLLEKENLFDKEAQVKAFNMAKDKIMAQLTLQAKEVLEKTYADYEAFIESKIEEIVENM